MIRAIFKGGIINKKINFAIVVINPFMVGEIENNAIAPVFFQNPLER